MRKLRVLILTLLLPAALLAQAPDTLSIPPDFVTDPGSFLQGNGVDVDTLDIQDGRLLLVLKDDHTWYYIKNFKLLENDSTFVKDWVPNSTDPYHVPLDSLPLRNTICLVDSTSRFVCPNQTKVYSRFGYRRGRRHQGVDLPLKTGTPVGLFEFRFFFSGGFQSGEGEEVSAQSIKDMIREFIAAEDPSKPLSDSQLSKMLGGKGFDVARRTVAKYREELGISSSQLRKAY